MRKKLYYKLIGLTHFIFCSIPRAFLSGFWQTIFKDEIKAFEAALAKEGFELIWYYWGISSASYTINRGSDRSRETYLKCSKIQYDFTECEKIRIAYNKGWYYIGEEHS